MLRRAALLCLTLSAPALAETQMTAAEFEAWSTGKTLDYFDAGQFWGSEQHLAGRATVDADAGGACQPGRWSPQGDDICFVYAASPGPHCWRFLKDGDTVIAEYLNDPDSPRYTVSLSDAPIPCSPPYVGV
jgi:hypothetical protein